MKPSGRRTDWLRETQLLLLLAVAAVVALGVLVPTATAVFGDRLELEVPSAGVQGGIDSGLEAGVSVAPEQDVTVAIADPSPGQRIGWALTVLPSQLVTAAMLALLAGLVRRARRDDPFTDFTVRRLRTTAAVAVGGGYLGFLIELLASVQLSSTVLADAVAGIAYLPAHWILIGFGLFAIAEIVRRGRAMRAELEAVV